MALNKEKPIILADAPTGNRNAGNSFLYQREEQLIGLTEMIQQCIDKDYIN